MIPTFTVEVLKSLSQTQNKNKVSLLNMLVIMALMPSALTFSSNLK